MNDSSPTRLSVAVDDDADYLDLCQHLTLAARRPLSLPEFHFAIISGLSEHQSLFWDESQVSLDDMKAELNRRSGGLLEVSGGIRPIVQFKRQTPLGGKVEDHEAFALCCLRAVKYASSNWQSRASTRRQFVNNNWKQMPFLRYAIEYIMNHFDRSHENVQEVFCREFDYCEWQLWATCLPALAALHTYNFGEALSNRLKCIRLSRYVRTYHAEMIWQGTSGSHPRFGRFRSRVLNLADGIGQRNGPQPRTQDLHNQYTISPEQDLRLPTFDEPNRPRVLVDRTRYTPPTLRERVSAPSSAVNEGISAAAVADHPISTPPEPPLTPTSWTYLDEMDWGSSDSIRTPSISCIGDAEVQSGEHALDEMNEQADHVFESYSDDDEMWDDIDYQSTILESLRDSTLPSESSGAVAA